MALTGIQSAEETRRNTDDEKLDPDPRTESKTLGGVVCTSSLSLEEILPKDIRLIAKISWFARQTVLAGVDNSFMTLERYEWNGEFFWGVTSNAV